MREIKFRAWDKDTQQFYYSDSPNADFIFGSKGSGVYINGRLVLDLMDENTDRYTGLKDKNGVEIYEGDIMRVRLNYQYRKTTPIDKQRRRKYIVGYRCGIHQQYTTAEYQLHILSEYFDDVGGYCGLSDIDMRDSEVIGNIYENPELLK